MRIALVAPLVTTIAQPFVGGAQAVVADLAQGLSQRGHQVTLFARAGSAVPGVDIEEVVVPDSVTPANFTQPGETHAGRGFFEQANIFLDLFLQLQHRSNEFDIVHAHAFDWPTFVCSALVRSLPVVHTIHLPAVSPEINEALSILQRQKQGLTLVTVSQACAQTYADGVVFDQVIYNGLDLTAIPFVDTVAQNAPLLFAGRITPEKGAEDAIKIAKRAGRRLLIAGGIYDQRYFEQCIEPHLSKVDGNVRYLGQLTHQQLWQLMGQVAALLFPIKWDEPFGLTPVEAMAAGTPVIAFRRGAVEEVISDGQTGFIVDPDDIKGAAAMVAHLDEISRDQCRMHVESNFSLDLMLSRYESVYRSFLI
jgi:UDP-glucose:tetrahydrobiopterin glucosyltransferase